MKDVCENCKVCDKNNNNVGCTGRECVCKFFIKKEIPKNNTKNK